MMYVFAATERRAGAWAREQGLKPVQYTPFGNRCRRFEGTRFSEGDQVVLVGNGISLRIQAMVSRTMLKTRAQPEVTAVPEAAVSHLR